MKSETIKRVKKRVVGINIYEEKPGDRIKAALMPEQKEDKGADKVK